MSRQRASGTHLTLVAGCGRMYLALGSDNKAIEQLNRALQQAELFEVPESRVPIRFALARVLWATPGERARALSLARTALDDMRSFGADVKAIEDWLAAHPASL